MRSLLPLIMLLPTIAQAQLDYLANVPGWRVYTGCNSQGWGGGPCITHDTHDYYLAGDTLIGGNTYRKVMRFGLLTHTWYGNWPPAETCTGVQTYLEPSIPIRQEGRAFYIWAEGQDQLLFDFDLEVGDTLPLTYNNTDQIVVVGLDSVEMNGAWRHRYALEGGVAQHIVEGVGSDNGLFEPISAIYECGHSLECFGLNGEPFYPSQSCLLGMQNVTEPVKEEISVILDNSAALLTVNLGSQMGVQPLHLFDAQGRLCLSTTLSGTIAQVDLRGLTSGTYLVNVGMYRERVVVVR